MNITKIESKYIPLEFHYEDPTNGVFCEYVEPIKEIWFYTKKFPLKMYHENFNDCLCVLIYCLNHEYLHIPICRIGREDDIYEQITNNKSHYIMAAGLDLCAYICFSHNYAEMSSFTTHTDGKEVTVNLKKAQEFFREVFLVKKKKN